MNSSTPQSSFQPASLKGGVPLAIGALLITQTLPLSPANAQVTEANSAEICTSPGFGGTHRSQLPGYKKCAGAPAAAIAAGLTQTEIFWIPAAQRPNTRGICSSSGPLSANLPRGIRIFTLINIVPSRQLTVNGTADGDVLIGSAESSDKLAGGGGQDTYVVGGLKASLTVQASDKVFPSSPVLEQDDLTFGGSTEYIHINPGGGQNNPGEIQTPLSSTPTITPRGGSAVPVATRAAAAAVCQASLATWEEYKLALHTTIASLPSRLWSDGTGVTPSLLAQPIQPVLDQRNPLNGSRGNGCNTQNCNINPDDSRADVGNKQGVPGAPTLRGFNIESPDADQIFVPSRNLVFQGEPINVAFPPGKEIPILVVQEGVRFGPARLLKQSQISQLQRQSRGLLSVKNKDIPLVYFRANGLLVISQSNAPLGTAENPGVVVARLLDSTNRPLDLPVSNDGIYPSRFLTFTPVRIPR
jgi:hypothetical protein